MTYPNMVKLRQRFTTERIDDSAAEVTKRIVASDLLDGIECGDRIAVTAGSRGIDTIDDILRAVVASLKSRGAEPFIVPAMGSHGGGTAEGQVAMLASLGITEESTGAPVVSSIETIELGATSSGAPVCIDRNARDADGIVVVNRVKLHTAFHGRVESGLCKMAAIGLGKIHGAETMHRMGLGEAIVEAFRIVRERTRILFGVALLENARDRILDIAVVPPERFEETDERFLARSREIVPRIPVSPFDILIVDEMGKNISGTGMDTNVVGFWRRFGGEKNPDYTTLIVRSLTPESHGNAMGIGLADLTTRRLVETIDTKSTYMNAMTSQWSMGRIPITLDNDRACIDAALDRHGWGDSRIVRIKNTLDLEEIAVSENLLPAVEGRPDIEKMGGIIPMAFDGDGYLV